jgi:hypothetical protein
MTAAAYIALAGLLVTLYVAGLASYQAWRAGTAHVKYVSHKLYRNPKVGSGWQVTVTVRNPGPGSARDPLLWLAPAGSANRPPVYASEDTLPPGDGVRFVLDVPVAEAGGEPLHVWARWRDRRGLRERDTGVAVRPD